VTRVAQTAFPELRRVFSGYLHEDALAESGSPEGALRAFRDDASPAEFRRFRKETTRFLAQTEALDLDELRRVLSRLGCRWMPSSRGELVALLANIVGEKQAGVP
jgi:CdiI immunity protein